MLSDCLLTIGSFWLAAFFYFFIISLGIDVIRVANHFFKFYPDFINKNYDFTKLVLFIASIA
jgi:hypothetical protein